MAAAATAPSSRTPIASPSGEAVGAAAGGSALQVPTLSGTAQDMFGPVQAVSQQ